MTQSPNTNPIYIYIDHHSAVSKSSFVNPGSFYFEFSIVLFSGVCIVQYISEIIAMGLLDETI